MRYPPLPGAAKVRLGVEYLAPAGEPANTLGLGAMPPEDAARTAFASDPFLNRELAPHPHPQGRGTQRMIVSERRRAPPPLQPEGERSLRTTDLQERWHLTREGIRAVENPLERVTMRFLSELIGDDHKRVTRAIGAPLLRSQTRLSSDPMSNYLDERDRMDHQQRLTENGWRMIRRPLRNALKELPIFNDVEVAIQSVKKTNVVTTDRRSRRPLGRLSVKIRAGRFEDPVELTWIKKGIRISSSQRYLKASYNTELLPDLHFRLRTRYNYVDYDWRLLGSLDYRLNDRTLIHALAGNLINVSTGLAPYPGGPQDDLRTKGMFILVEHHF